MVRVWPFGGILAARREEAGSPMVLFHVRRVRAAAGEQLQWRVFLAVTALQDAPLE